MTMNEDTSRNAGGEQADDRTGTHASTSRRRFLKATATGALVAGAGLSTTGTAAGNGIPTPWLSRDGNKIVDESGNEVVLRGVNIADPKRINSTASARGKTAEQVIDYATDADKGWHSRVIRLPIHPGDIAELPPIPKADVNVHMPPTFTQSQLEEYLENHLDPVVQKCKAEGIYCIVDYHRHWGSGTLNWNNPELSEEIHMFWETVAPRYSDMSNVIYELYNEPTTPGIFDDPNDRQYEADRWRTWRETAQPWVDTIREHADNLTIIGSPSWSQTPEGALVEEFEGEDLAYAYHIYPGHSISQSGDWDGNNTNGEGVSQAYEEVPLFATEFGWQTGISAYPTIGTTSEFGEPFVNWLESNNISWTAWCFDPTWLSSMVKRSFEAGGSQDAIGDPYSGDIPTYCDDLPCEWEPRTGENMGGYIKQVLADKKDDKIPTGGSGGSDTQAPTTPANFASPNQTSTSIALTWDASTDAGGSGLDHYYIHANHDRPTTDVFVKDVPAGTTETTLADVYADANYDVSVHAVDAAGNESDPATLTTSTPPEDGASPTIEFRPTPAAITPGSSGPMGIFLSSVPDGLSGFEIEVSVADTSILTITGASYGSTYGMTEDAQIADDGSSVTLKAVDVEDTIKAGAEDVELALLELTGQSSGETTLDVSVTSMDADDGGIIEPSTSPFSVPVYQSSQVEEIEGQMPTDPDGDGHYEDLNGNGRIDSDDVVTYFEHKDDVASLFDEV